jgi:hypothetical protein
MGSDYLTRSDVIYIYSYCDKCVGIICFYKILSIRIKRHSVNWITRTIFTYCPVLQNQFFLHVTVKLVTLLKNIFISN